MVKEVSSNTSGVQGSFPEESAKQLTKKEMKTEGTAQGAFTDPSVIEVIPGVLPQRRVSARNFLQGLVNLIGRIGQLFSRLNPSRLSGRDQQPRLSGRDQQQPVEAKQEQLPKLSMGDIKELDSQLKSAIETIEKFHFEPISANLPFEDEIEQLENKDVDIREIQQVIGEIFGLIEALPANDPLKNSANLVLTSLRSKLKEIKDHYSALEAKYGDKTARFIQQLKQNPQFNGEFGRVVEILVSDEDLDKKLTDYVTTFSPIVREFTGKTNPGTEEIQSVLEAGFQNLKESNPDQFNELKTILENAEALPIVQIEGHPNVVLNLQLLTLQQMVNFVSGEA
jgi:hypothetical protein